MPLLEKRTSSDRRHHLGHALGDREFALGRQREDAADLHALARGFIDAVIGIAEDRRAVAEPVVDIAIAVDVPGAAALAVIDIDGALIAPVAEGRGDAERQALQGLLEVGIGRREVALVALEHDAPAI